MKDARRRAASGHLRRVLAVLCAVVLAACGTSAPEVRFGRYVALGDSYSAAAGVQPVEDAACGRSSVNYPHLLARRIHADLVDVTCAGATTRDVLEGSATAHPQIDAVTADTRLVTVGIGGNDLDLSGIIRTCLVDPGCAKRLPELAPAVEALARGLDQVLAAVRERAPGAKVVVVGYPGPAIVDGGCPRLPLDPTLLDAARQVTVLLDDAQRAAASRAGVSFLDLSAPSRGHGVCSEDPWIAGIDGSGAQPLHPLAVEQRAVAALVAEFV